MNWIFGEVLERHLEVDVQVKEKIYGWQPLLYCWALCFWPDSCPFVRNVVLNNQEEAVIDIFLPLHVYVLYQRSFLCCHETEFVNNSEIERGPLKFCSTAIVCYKSARDACIMNEHVYCLEIRVTFIIFCYLLPWMWHDARASYYSRPMKTCRGNL